MQHSSSVCAAVVTAFFGLIAPAQAQFNTERFLQDIIGAGIVIAVDQANKNSTNDGPRPRSVAPTIASDPALLAAQNALNALGYNAGVADGVNGRRTREAIMAFQSSIGEVPTGALTPAQTQQLHSAAASAYGAVSALPPVQSAQLSRAEILDLQRRLAAFGYDVGTPDGIVGSRTRNALAAHLSRLGLSPNLTMRQGYEQIAMAHSSLNLAPAATFPIGQTVDVGQAALTGSGFDALNALATGGQSAAAPAGPDAPQFGSTATVEAQPSVAVPPPAAGFDQIKTEYAFEHPAIMRMLVAARPSVLDDEEFLTDLFETDGHKFTSTYRVEEELEAYKREYLARPVPEVVYVDLSYDVSMRRSTYSRDLGIFPFYESFNPQTEGYINLRASLDEGYPLSFAVPNLPKVDGLPMTLEQAEAFEREGMGRDDHYFAEVHRNVAITAIRFDEARGAFEGDLTLFSIEATRRFGDEEHLHTWALATPTTEQSAALPSVASLAELANVLPGIVLIDGHFDIHASVGWPGVAASLYLSQNLKAMEQADSISAMGRALLSEAEQVELWRGKIPRDWQEISRLSHDEQQQAARVILNEYEPQILSRTIGPDFGVVEVFEASITGYDPTTGLMALNRALPETQVGSLDHDATLRWNFGGTVVPDAVPLDQALAQKIIALFNGNPSGQKLYIGLYANVTNVATGIEGGRFRYSADLSAKPTRIALYRDRQLTDLIFDYYEDPNEWLLNQQRRRDELSALITMAPPSVDAMHRIAMDVSKDATYLDDQIAHTLKESRLNEFDRVDAIERLKTGVSALQVPDPLWLTGNFSLGEYDATAGSFAIKSMNTSYQKSALGFASDKINTAFIASPAGVSVPVEQARQFVASSDEYRKVSVRMLVKPIHVSVERNRYGEVIPTITYHLERMVVLTGNTTLSDTDFGPYGGLSTASSAAEPAAAVLSDVPLFDQELAALIAYGDGSKKLNDGEFHRMLASRWLAEQPGMSPSITSRFFPQGTQLPALASVDIYRADFENWLAAQGPFAPNKLRINVDFRDSHMADRVPAQCNEMEWGLRYVGQNQQLVSSLFGPEGSGMQDNQMRFIGDGTDEKPAIIDNVLLGFPRATLANCNIGVTKGLESAWEIRDDTVPASVFVIVDKMPMANFLRRSKFTAASIEVSVTRIETRPVANGLPIVIIHTTLDSAELIAASVQGNTLNVIETMAFTKESLAPQQLGLDLVGIHLGMSEADADRAVRAYMADALVFKSVVDLTPATPDISDVTLYLAPDYKQSVSLIFEAGTGERTVLGVGRSIRAPDWGLSRSDVTASAIAKYGEPDHSNVQQFETRLGWGESTSNRYCVRADDGSKMGDVWMNEAGVTGRIAEFVEWNAARDSGTLYVPGPTWDEDMKRCGGMLLLQHNEYGLKTFLFDPAQYYAAWQKSLQMGQEIIDQKVKEGGGGAIVF